MDVRAGEPVTDCAAVHDCRVSGVLRRRERVHRVLNRLLFPRSSVGMIWKHGRRHRDASEIPAVFFGFGVIETAARWFAVEEAVGFVSDDMFDVTAKLGVEIVPDQPRAESGRGIPKSGLPMIAPRFAVGTFLRAGDMSGNEVTECGEGFTFAFLAFGRSEDVGIFQQRSVGQNHSAHRPNALLGARPSVIAANPWVSGCVGKELITVTAAVAEHGDVSLQQFLFRKRANGVEILCVGAKREEAQQQ